MNGSKLSILFVLALNLILVGSLGAIQITGKVAATSGDTITIAMDGDVLPSVRDQVEVYFKMGKADVAVGTGKITEARPGSVQAKIDNATGKVAKDQLVRIDSPNPRKQAADAAPRSRPNANTPEGPPSTVPPLGVSQPKAETISFDNLAPGTISEEVFADRGLHLKANSGKPGIYQAEPTMLIPSPYRHVLMLAGERVTSFTIGFEKPVKGFTLVRVGTSGGASIPSWTMKVFDTRGRLLGSAGENHGSPTMAQAFPVEGRDIARVEISTDNRYGSGTWATWSSLPIAAFSFNRPNEAPPLATQSEPQWTDLTNASQKIVGTWQGQRHRKQYFADGTMVTDPHLVPDPPRIRWQIEGDRLTEFHTGGNITLRIVSIDNRALVTSDGEGHTYREARIPDEQARKEKANW